MAYLKDSVNYATNHCLNKESSMRSKRMRGYGSWCMGWKEAEKSRKSHPNNDGNGLGSIIFYFFLIVIAITFFQVAVQTGNPLGILLGFAIITGMLKGAYS